MAAPQLRLEVSLNLAGFRNEMRRLTQVAQSEFNPLLKVNIDVKDYRAQLRQLEKIKPVIKIEDSQIDGARARLASLNKSLATLRRATSTPIEIKLKYVEVGKPPSAAAGQIGQAVSGRVRADQAVAALNREQAVAARNMLKAANVPVGGLGTGRSLDAYRKSITEGMAKAGKESIAGLAQGLKDGQSAIGQAAKIVGDEGVRAIKATLGIASPSRVFKQIGEFSVDGLEIGFLNGLKDFKSKSLAEIRKIVALMQFELAKVSGVSMAPGMSRSAGSRGSNQFMSPIGPLPEGSQEPWAFSQYRYQPFMAQPGQTRGAGVPPMRQRFPFLPAPPVMGTTVSSPGMYGASFPALPPAGGTAATRETMLAMRELEARVRSAARAASIFAEDMVSAGRRNVLPPAGGGGGTAIVPHRSFVGPTSRQAIPMGAGGGALVPYAGGGGNVPPGPPPGGGGGGGGGSFGGGGFNVPNLPGAGLVREIGTEFGFAAKQVLLFGTAYKALAFIQGFPAQVGDAVGALQSFRNTLGAISPSAEEAAESSQFILDVVDKYNTPIQSARDGFTKLYASMKPTGFSGDEIRDLFLGISQAAATFGMSAEKVDRVNYAFAQMASKGQVMSEELKGQLGDVLPGAMGIFAEAAGFEGPDAITKFSKALEDGAYKGAAMKTLLTNVGIVMRKEFGPGAEGAARTFQGVINRMQNSFKLLYESFEPVAVGFLNSVVMPLTSGIKTVTDGFNAFFTGQAAQTAGGSVFAKQLELLRPTFEGIAANIKQVLPLLQSFANTALSLGQVLLQIAGNPFAGYLARIYLSVLPLTVALRVLNLQVLIPLIGSFLRAIPAFISFNAAMISGTSANKGLQLAMQLTGQTAGVTAGKIRLVGAALATLGTTAILAGIGLLIERFLMMKSAIDGVRQSTQQMLGSISGMANAGAVKELQNVSKNIQKQKDTFAELKKFVSGGRLGGGSKALTPEMAAKFEEVGMGSFVSKNLFGKPIITDFLKATEIIDAKLQGLNKESSSVAEKLPLAVKVAADIARQAKTAETIAPIPEGGATDSTKSKQERESQVPLLKLELQYQKELLPLESEINRARLLDNNLTVIRLEGEKNILDLKYEAFRINLEDIPVAEKRLKIEALQAKGQISALKTRYDIEFEIAKILEEHDKTLESMEEKSNLELLNRKSYIELLLNGIKPAHAKITIEVENEIAALTESLELRRLNLEEEIKLLQAKKAGGGTIDEDRLAELQSGLGNTKQRLADLPAFGTGETARRLAIADAPKLSQEYTAEGLEAAQDRLEELTNTGYQVVQAANAIGDAFGEAFKGVITGSMTAQEALAGMFRSIADHFADMVAQMIAEYLKMQAIGLLKTIFGAVAGGLGGGGANLGPNSSAVFGLNTPDMMQYSPLTAANGAVWGGGFTAFANGGMVTGPTMGLVGEGRYNEAIIPLPDGKSVPVQLSGSAGGNAAPINTSIVVNVKNGQAESQMSGNQGNQLARELEGAVRQVILKESRPGGLISSSR